MPYIHTWSFFSVGHECGAIFIFMITLENVHTTQTSDKISPACHIYSIL